MTVVLNLRTVVSFTEKARWSEVGGRQSQFERKLVGGGSAHLNRNVCAQKYAAGDWGEQDFGVTIADLV